MPSKAFSEKHIAQRKIGGQNKSKILMIQHVPRWGTGKVFRGHRWAKYGPPSSLHHPPHQIRVILKSAPGMVRSRGEADPRGSEKEGAVPLRAQESASSKKVPGWPHSGPPWASDVAKQSPNEVREGRHLSSASSSLSSSACTSARLPRPPYQPDLYLVDTSDSPTA